MVEYSLALLFAFLAPLMWAIMNIFDKYVVDNKVKDTVGFTVMSGAFNFLCGLIIAVIVTWNGIGFAQIWPSIIVGILYAAFCFIYMVSLEKSDISSITGMMYLYPIIVAILAFIFLGETLTPLGYLGAGLTIVGVIILSLNFYDISIKGLLPIISIILILGVWEFFIKVASDTLTVWQGTAIIQMVAGIVLLSALVIPKVRKNAVGEIRNFHWGIIVVIFESLGVWVGFYAMQSLDVTFVSCIGTLQPFFVLVIEWVTHQYVPMAKDENFIQKLIAIAIIVIGVILLTMTGA